MKKYIYLLLVASLCVLADQEAGTKAGEPSNLSSEEFETLFEKEDASSSSFAFEADVSRLMDIIINSLYTHKEVFLRELISNASDALNKIRYQSISKPEALGDHKDLEIRIDFNADEKTISITDTGVGMTKNDLVQNLGTVADSGTTKFIVENVSQGTDSSNLIGQFGVGFYSVYLVANKVVVTSKNNDDDQYIWTSTAGSQFQVAKDPRGNTLGRGTRVTLHLKEDAIEMVEQQKIKELVKRYSEYIDFPIYLYVLNKKTKQVPEEEEDAEEGEERDAAEETQEEKSEEGEEKEDDEIIEEEESEGADSKPKEPKMKTVTQEKWEWELVNENKAIWLRPKDEIEEEDYHNFYKAISNDYDKPLTYSHFTAEGEIEFRSLLFVPAHAPYDMFENYYGRSSSLKLYVRRVLITEEFEELLPRYLNFIKGVLDSDDLPLNVSREQLQQLKILKVISKKLVRKTIEMIKELAEEGMKKDEEEEDLEEEEEESKDAPEEESTDETEEAEEKEAEESEEPKENRYHKFFKAFGKNIKLGVIEDSSNRNKLAKLLRFFSSKSVDELISLQDYVDRMSEKQENIYYLAGEDRHEMMRSPLIQRMIKEDIEILLLDDPIDEFCMQHLAEFEKKKLQSAAKEGVEFEDDIITKKKEAKLAQMYEPLCKWMKDTIGKDVEKVKISNRLVDIPSVIVSSQYGYSAQMEKVSRAQAFANAEKTPSYQLSRKHLELNPYHPAIKSLLDKVLKAQEEEREVDEETKKQAMIVWDMSIVNSGFMIERSQEFTKEIERLLNYRMGLDPDAENIEIDIEIDEDEEEEATAGEGAEDASQEGESEESGDASEEGEETQEEGQSDL